MPTPTLSVIVPYYKGAETIGPAIESVLAQTVAPDEIVICDDGSPDDLRAALGGLAGEVRIVRKENGGISSAMNAAAEAATGEFLVQLDQDDLFLPRRIETIAALLAERPELDIVMTDAYVEFEGVRQARVAELYPFPAERDQRTAILQYPYLLWPTIRKTRLDAIGGYDTTFPVMHDWECFMRLVLDGALAGFVDEPVYRYRLTPGSRSSTDPTESTTMLIRALDMVLARDDLSADERAAATATRRAQELMRTQERGRWALLERSPEARRLALPVLLNGGYRPQTRLRAAVTLLSPAIARRFVQRRTENEPVREAFIRRGMPLPR